MFELQGLFGLLILIADIYALIKIFGSRAEALTKAIWAAIVIVLPLLGVVAWFLAGPGNKD